MAKSKETFNKKEKEKKRLKQRQEKAEKMQERKANAKSGKSLDEMMAYIDENGNITSTPPDPSKRREVSLEEIEIGVPKGRNEEPEEAIRTGVVNFFNPAKGFGFIRDSRSGESIFFHENQLNERLNEGDRIQFETEPGQKGPVAVRVVKLK